MSFTQSVLEFEFWREGDRGEQWGLGLHDLDGNGYLDLYANHHGYPRREIIYNFATDDPEHVELLIGGDQHGVTFFDIDQDGDADLLQATGGALGSIGDPDDPEFWNKAHLNEGGVIDPANSMDRFGIEYGPGRGRLLVPINFDGALAIYAGVRNDREDGTYPGELFGRAGDGSYDPIAPLGDAVSGELAKGVHFGTDGFVDVINVDAQARELRVFENAGAGFGDPVVLSRNRIIYDVATGDFDGDLEAEILLSQTEISPTPGAVLGRERIYSRGEDGTWTNNADAMPTRDTRTVALTVGDFDNDGDLDYAALQLTRGLDLYLYLNRGDGTFELGSRTQDPSFTGLNAYLYRGDFNRDGALDLIVTNSNRQQVEDGAYILLEGVPNGANWLSVQLHGVVSETGGLGARVYVTTPDGATRVLEQDSGARFQAQDSTDLHFGLGEADTADVLIVWPDGVRQAFVGVAANQHIVLTERRDAAFDLVIEGSTEADTIRGSAQDDLIFGLAGNDTISGRRGNDALNGGFGADRLFGGPGDDVLTGGAGADRMTGEGGADRFVFLAPEESPMEGERDVIRDFQRGLDVIDLSAIDANVGAPGDQRFAFIGEAAFSGLPRQLRFADGVLEGDVDADGAADFQIEVAGIAALSAADFVL